MQQDIVALSAIIKVYYVQQNIDWSWLWLSFPRVISHELEGEGCCSARHIRVHSLFQLEQVGLNKEKKKDNERSEYSDINNAITSLAVPTKGFERAQHESLSHSKNLTE